jgi:hypothetical protein
LAGLLAAACGTVVAAGCDGAAPDCPGGCAAGFVCYYGECVPSIPDAGAEALGDADSLDREDEAEDALRDEVGAEDASREETGAEDAPFDEAGAEDVPVDEVGAEDAPRDDPGAGDADGGCIPSPAEICNGTDDDCDGATDEGCGGSNDDDPACLGPPSGASRASLSLPAGIYYLFVDQARADGALCGGYQLDISGI